MQLAVSHNKSNKTKITIIVIVCILLAAVGVTVWQAIDQQNKIIWEEEHLEYPLHFDIAAQGYDPATSSPIPIHIEGTDFENTSIAKDVLIGADGCEPVKLMRGTYSISVLASPFLSDGSMFEFDNNAITTVEIEKPDIGEAASSNQESNSISYITAPISLSPLPTAALTEDVIDHTADQLSALGYDVEAINKYKNAALSTMKSEQLKAELAAAKKRFSSSLAKLNATSKEDPRYAGTQSEMNEASNEYRQKYDALVEDIYVYLQKTLPNDKVTNLKSNQAQWEKRKDAAVEEEGNITAGGTIRPLAMHSTAITFDKERIQELLEYMN